MNSIPLLESIPSMVIVGLFMEGVAFLYLITNGKISRKIVRDVFLSLFLIYGICAFIMFLIGSAGGPIGTALVILWVINLIAGGAFIEIDNRLHPDEVLERERSLQ